MLWKCYTQYVNKFGKLRGGQRIGKVSFHSNPKERQCQRMFKLPYHTITLTFTCSKSFKLCFSNMWTENFQMYKLGIEKAETRDQIANICWIIEKGREFKNKSTFDSLTALKSLTLWITINCGKLLKRWEYQTTLPAFWETFMWDKKQHLEMDMEKQT